MRPTGLLEPIRALDFRGLWGNSPPLMRLDRPAGWAGSRVAIAFIGDVPSDLPMFPGDDTGDRVIAMLNRPRTPLAEDVSAREPFVSVGKPAETTPCTACDGSGECTCTCGDEHDCPRCDGDGAIEVVPRQPEQLGKRVYRGEGREVHLQDRIGALFEGLTPVSLGPDHDDPVGGVDADGDIVLLTMGMRR